MLPMQQSAATTSCGGMWREEIFGMLCARTGAQDRLRKCDWGRRASEFSAGDITSVGAAQQRNSGSSASTHPGITSTPPASRRQDGGWRQTVKVDRHVEGKKDNSTEREKVRKARCR